MHLGAMNIWKDVILSDQSPICVFDTDFRLVAFNDAHNDEFERVNGFRTKEGDIFPDLLVEEQRPVMRALMARALSGETFTVVEAFGNPELERPHWKIRYTPIRNAAGDVIAAFHRADDVSAQLRAEAELAQARNNLELARRAEVAALAVSEERTRSAAAIRESEARFRNMADNTPVMMWVTDPSGYCTYLNERWYEFTGQTEACALGYGWLDATHPEDKLRVEEAFSASNAACSPFTAEYRLRSADGTYRWALDAASPRFASSGEYLGYVGSVIDIDERRQSEQRLQESEERLRLAIEAAEIGQWDLDPDGDTLFWPPRVKAMFGISPERPISMRDFYTGLHPEDVTATSEAFEATTDPERRALYDVEYRTIGKEDGIVRWVAAKGRGIFGGDGRCLRVIGTAIDITGRKRIEAELRELNEDLERRVEEALAERAKAEDQLRQAQKMEVVGQLTGGIAHDFNNLLMGVRGNLELIERRVVGDERLQRYLGNAISAVDKGAKITAQLLAFSRSQRLSIRPIPVNQVLTSARDLIGNALGPNIQIHLRLSVTTLWAMGDPDQLELALLNLAVNARDAMGDGGELWIDVSEKLENDAGGGMRVSVKVTDNGSGMTPETLSRAVEPFFTTKELGKGTGLGLAQVYGFARQCGGDLRILSRLGQGTTVEILLPCAEDKPVDADAFLVAIDTPVKLRTGVGDLVVIDDDEGVRSVIVDALTSAGFKVSQASDGPSGLALIRQLKPAAAVIDFLMPGMNGAEVARAAQETQPDLPIIFVSGYSDTLALDGIAGAIVLRKPFNIDGLSRAVAAVLQ